MVPLLNVFLYKILRIAATKFPSCRKWWPKLEVSDQYLISVQIENLQNREQVCLESLFCKESFFFFLSLTSLIYTEATFLNSTAVGGGWGKHSSNKSKPKLRESGGSLCLLWNCGQPFVLSKQFSARRMQDYKH